MIQRTDSYDDRKFCPTCRCYVRYASSIERSHCVECGGEVNLFSEADLAAFKLACRSAGWHSAVWRADGEEEGAPEVWRHRTPRRAE